MEPVKPPSQTTDASAPLSFADHVNAYTAAGVPRMHSLGIRVLELEEGRVVGFVPLEGNGNHLGSMYAGTLFGLAEMLGGAIARPTFDFAEYYPVVKDVAIKFLRPARTDIRGYASITPETIARISAEAAESGRAEFVVDAELVDTSGTVVAVSHGTYQVRSVGG